MSRKYFLNLTDFLLTKDQLFILGQAGFTIVEREAIFDDETLEKLSQSPSSKQELMELSRKAVSQIEVFVKIIGAYTIHIHLPIGSPDFQAVFFTDLVRHFKNYDDVKLVFSHIKPILEERDGDVVSTFKLERFIEIDPKEITC